MPVSLLGVCAGPFNALYYGFGKVRSGSRRTRFGSYLFPLDRIGPWARVHGRQAFIQYQCVLPESESPSGLRQLLECVARTRKGFLGVLKQLGDAGDGLLSFPMRGYTLALDLPVWNDLPELVDALDEIKRAHGGRIYLAKDSCSSPALLRAGYPRLAEFQDACDVLGGGKFASALSERLDL